jgi:Na+:H+ antiporter, NhaC family
MAWIFVENHQGGLQAVGCTNHTVHHDIADHRHADRRMDISPMSDSTNLTPSVLGVNLYDHIRHMLYTTLPALGISLIVFTVMGFIPSSNNGNGGDVSAYTDYIREHFNLSIWLFIPQLLMIFLIIKKIPAIPSLLSGLILGGIAYLLIQGGTFSGFLESIHTGFVMDTGQDEMDALFTRGGMDSMYEVVALALISLTLGGIMDYTGMLHSLVLVLSRLTNTVGNLTATVLGKSVFVNLFGANQYLDCRHYCIGLWLSEYHYAQV